MVRKIIHHVISTLNSPLGKQGGIAQFLYPCWESSTAPEPRLEPGTNDCEPYVLTVK